jgi:flavin-dependent dehydrogenase
MKPITIIGGGLAGLTLGILLRRENIAAAVIEAGRYPRHRVCGEFLSGRGREILRELELEERIPRAMEGASCSFHLQDREPIRFQMAEAALCVSRFDLDHFLAEEFQRGGGILKTGERAEVNGADVGVVRATGRRRSHDGKGKLFGLKAHARLPSEEVRGDARPPGINTRIENFGRRVFGRPMESVGKPRALQNASDLELHFGGREYVGICRLAEGRVNVCGLFYSEEAASNVHREWKRIFERSVWSGALRDVTWDEESFSAVAGLTLDRDAPEDCFAIGDAAAMIPPLTGNGMSMAIESADVAVDLLRKYARGEMSWDDCVRGHALKWREHFSRRLRWAGFVQRLLFRPAGQRVLYLGARLAPRLPNLFFSRTR